MTYILGLAVLLIIVLLIIGATVPRPSRAAVALQIERQDAALRSAHAEHMARSTGHPAGRLRTNKEIDNGADWNE